MENVPAAEAALVSVADRPLLVPRRKRRFGQTAGTAASHAVLILLSLFALLPLLLMTPKTALLGVAMGAVAALAVAAQACRGLGGYTGDVLGATVAIYETGFLMGVAALKAS